MAFQRRTPRPAIIQTKIPPTSSVPSTTAIATTSFTEVAFDGHNPRHNHHSKPIHHNHKHHNPQHPHDDDGIALSTTSSSTTAMASTRRKMRLAVSRSGGTSTATASRPFDAEGRSNAEGPRRSRSRRDGGPSSSSPSPTLSNGTATTSESSGVVSGNGNGSGGGDGRAKDGDGRGDGEGVGSADDHRNRNHHGSLWKDNNHCSRNNRNNGNNNINISGQSANRRRMMRHLAKMGNHGGKDKEGEGDEPDRPVDAAGNGNHRDRHGRGNQNVHPPPAWKLHLTVSHSVDSDDNGTCFNSIGTTTPRNPQCATSPGAEEGDASAAGGPSRGVPTDRRGVRNAHGQPLRPLQPLRQSRDLQQPPQPSQLQSQLQSHSQTLHGNDLDTPSTERHSSSTKLLSPLLETSPRSDNTTAAVFVHDNETKERHSNDNDNNNNNNTIGELDNAHDDDHPPNPPHAYIHANDENATSSPHPHENPRNIANHATDAPTSSRRHLSSSIWDRPEEMTSSYGWGKEGADGKTKNVDRGKWRSYDDDRRRRDRGGGPPSVASSVAGSNRGWEDRHGDRDDDGTAAFRYPTTSSSKTLYLRHRGRAKNGKHVLLSNLTEDQEEEEEEGVDEIMNKPNVKAALGVGAAATLGAVILGPIGLLVGAASAGIGMGVMQIPQEHRNRVCQSAASSLDQAREYAFEVSDHCGRFYGRDSSDDDDDDGDNDHGRRRRRSRRRRDPSAADVHRDIVDRCCSAVGEDTTRRGDDDLSWKGPKMDVMVGAGAGGAEIRPLGSSPLANARNGVGNGIKGLVGDVLGDDHTSPSHSVGGEKHDGGMMAEREEVGRRVACGRKGRVVPLSQIHSLRPSLQPRAWLDVMASAHTSRSDKNEAMEEILILAKDKDISRWFLEEGILDSLMYILSTYFRNYSAFLRDEPPTNETSEPFLSFKPGGEAFHHAKLAANCCVALGKAHCAAVHTEGDLLLMSAYSRGSVPVERQLAQMLFEVPHHMKVMNHPGGQGGSVGGGGNDGVVEGEYFTLTELSMQQAEDLASSIKALDDGRIDV